MGLMQYLALIVPAAVLLLGAISMLGADNAAATAAQSLVAPESAVMNSDVAEQKPAEPDSE